MVVVCCLLLLLFVLGGCDRRLLAVVLFVPVVCPLLIVLCRPLLIALGSAA